MLQSRRVKAALPNKRFGPNVKHLITQMAAES